jgi:DNA-binding NarL/FixJ family response regulator
MSPRARSSERADRSVLVASSDRLFAEAAAVYFDATPGWHCMGVAADGVAAVTALARRGAAAVFISGELPRLSVAGLAQQVRRRWPDVTIAVHGAPSPPGALALETGADASAVLKALGSSPGEAAEREREPDAMSLLRGLTRRERVVLTHLAVGRSQTEIAALLGVSANTVRTHVQNIHAKLGQHTRLDVVRFAVEHGLVSGDDGPA